MNHENNDVELVAVGDISLKPANSQEPFKEFGNQISAADISFGNLETVADAGFKAQEKSVVMGVPSEKIELLNDAGFDILNVANNHIFDRGESGYRLTLQTLNEAGIRYLGGKLQNTPSWEIIEKHGISIGFLGYTDSVIPAPITDLINPLNVKSNLDFYLGREHSPSPVNMDTELVNQLQLDKIKSDIAWMDQKCDTVVVSLHWGVENVPYPSPLQIKYAHGIIDAGGDIILGHHPHVPQGIEEYGEGVIFYSLGNFQFEPDPTHSWTHKSILVNISIDKNGYQRHDLIPISINEAGEPRVVKEAALREQIFDHLKDISEPLEKGSISYQWWFEKISDTYLNDNYRSYKKRIGAFGLSHLPEFCLWLASPFNIRCYYHLLRQKVNSNLP